MSKPIVKIGLFALSYLKPISFYNQHQGAQKACKFHYGAQFAQFEECQAHLRHFHQTTCDGEITCTRIGLRHLWSYLTGGWQVRPVTPNLVMSLVNTSGCENILNVKEYTTQWILSQSTFFLLFFFLNKVTFTLLRFSCAQCAFVGWVLLDVCTLNADTVCRF